MTGGAGGDATGQVREFRLPRLGDGDGGGRIVAWLKAPGEAFRRGDVLLEVETDKAVVEVEAEEDGVLVEILLGTDATVPIDAAIALVEGAAAGAPSAAVAAQPLRGPSSATAAGALDAPAGSGAAPPGHGTAAASGSAPASDAGAASGAVGRAPAAAPAAAHVPGIDGAPDASVAASAASAPAHGAAENPDASAAPDPEVRAGVAAGAAARGGRVAATPLARRLARERGIDLGTLLGSGRRGRIRRADVDRAAGPAAPAVRREAKHSASRTLAPAVATAEGAIAYRRWSPATGAPRATVALVHGLFGDADVWAGTAAALIHTGVEVVAIDLPNHGRSEAAATGFEEVARAAAEAVATLADGPLVLAGHSYGGAVAARIAASPDLDLRGLALLAPVGLGAEIGQAFLDGVLAARSADALEREMSRLTSGGAFLPTRAYLGRLADRMAARADGLAAMCRAVARDGVQQVDARPWIAATGARTAIVWGRRDAILPWQHALAAPPSAALHLVPEAGHMPQWEAGALTARILASLAGTA